MSDLIPLLYLEDDTVLAAVTSRALAKRGYRVTHFPSNERARQTLAVDHFAFALLDLKLEDGSALELIEDLVRTFPAIKIVVLTGYASIATAVQAIKLGAVNYLSKPAGIEQILRAFDEVPQTDEDLDHVMPLRRLEWEHIQQALVDNHGNISATARQLKMHRRTLQRKLGKKPVADGEI